MSTKTGVKLATLWLLLATPLVAQDRLRRMPG